MLILPALLGALALASDPIADLKTALAKPAPDASALADTSPLTRPQAEQALTALMDATLAKLRAERQAEWTAKSITIDGKTMKFDFKVFGKPDAGQGRRLFISMHGGGSAPPEVNEQQWKNQIRLYTPEEGVYLAPRAPTDAWNMWHEAHIDRFFDRIIQDAALFENVDTNRVYLTGYSAGGDGVYQMGPRMADRWAAAAMMAGHPNDASALNLRNVPFAIHVGANDGAFDRNKIAAQWGKALDELKAADPDGYVHVTQVHEGRGHWMNREDSVAIGWMSGFTRSAWPRKVVWQQDDVITPRLYWIQVDPAKAKKGDQIIAIVEGNSITLTAPQSLGTLTLWLSDALVDLDKPVIVKVNGKQAHDAIVPRTIAACAASVASRPDPKLGAVAELSITIPQ